MQRYPWIVHTELNLLGRIVGIDLPGVDLQLHPDFRWRGVILNRRFEPQLGSNRAPVERGMPEPGLKHFPNARQNRPHRAARRPDQVDVLRIPHRHGEMRLRLTTRSLYPSSFDDQELR